MHFSVAIGLFVIPEISADLMVDIIPGQSVKLHVMSLFRFKVPLTSYVFGFLLMEDLQKELLNSFTEEIRNFGCINST